MQPGQRVAGVGRPDDGRDLSAGASSITPANATGFAVAVSMRGNRGYTEDPDWTRRYHSHDPKEKAFGARAVITFEDGSTLVDELGIANAHPFGARPFGRKEYIQKFRTLTDEILDPKESARFLDLVQRLPDLSAADVLTLNPVAPAGYLKENPAKGIF